MNNGAVPLLVLSAIPVAFLTARRFHPLGWAALAVRLLAVLPLFVSGSLHLARPQFFLPAIPPPFPPESWFATLTGLPELLGACGLLVGRTRRTAAVCLAVYLVAIFPANLYIAGRTIGGIPMPRVPARTLMQAGYILLVLVAGWGVPIPKLLSHSRSSAPSLTPPGRR